MKRVKRFLRKPSRLVLLLALLTLCVILAPLCIGGAVWAMTGSLMQGYQACLICIAIEGAAIALAGGLYLTGAALVEVGEAKQGKKESEDSPSSIRQEANYE